MSSSNTLSAEDTVMKKSPGGKNWRQIPSRPENWADEDGRIWYRNSDGEVVERMYRKHRWPGNPKRWYWYVRFRIGGRKRVDVMRHHLVLEAWHGPRPDGLDGLHIDGNELNCRPDNLKWGTKQENMRHRTRDGKFKHPGWIVDEEMVERILMSGMGTMEMARQLKISPATVSKIRNGQRHKDKIARVLFSENMI